MTTTRAGLPVTFIVRLTTNEDGSLAGTVERVRTGEKRRFRDPQALGVLIAHMAGRPDRRSEDAP
jgi:hypothetical protein